MNPHNLAAALLSISLVACSSSSDGEGGGQGGDADTPHFAYITNGAVSFWTIAEAGAYEGGEEYGVKGSVLLPAGGMTDQKNVIEDMLTKGGLGDRPPAVGAGPFASFGFSAFAFQPIASHTLACIQSVKAFAYSVSCFCTGGGRRFQTGRPR